MLGIMGDLLYIYIYTLLHYAVSNKFKKYPT